MQIGRNQVAGIYLFIYFFYIAFISVNRTSHDLKSVKEQPTKVEQFIKTFFVYHLQVMETSFQCPRSDGFSVSFMVSWGYHCSRW